MNPDCSVWDSSPERKKTYFYSLAPLAVRARLSAHTSLEWQASCPAGYFLALTQYLPEAGTAHLSVRIPRERRRHPGGSRLRLLFINLSVAPLKIKSRYGEAGIRTLGGGFPPQLLSRQLPSAARPPLPSSLAERCSSSDRLILIPPNNFLPKLNTSSFFYNSILLSSPHLPFTIYSIHKKRSKWSIVNRAKISFQEIFGG